MSWNHRVVKRTYPAPSNETFYQIHEVYYGIQSRGSVCITSEPKSLTAESIDGLRWTLQRMLQALDKPVLDYETSKEIESYKPEAPFKAQARQIAQMYNGLAQAEKRTDFEECL